MVPSPKGKVGELSTPPVSVIAFSVTFCAAAVPVFTMGTALRSVPPLRLSPAGPSDRTAADASHTTSMVRKLPGLEASATVRWFTAASPTGLTMVDTF